MKTLRKCFLYALYVLVLVVGFGYYLFPSDAIRGWLEFRFGEAFPEFRISIRDLSPDFPPGLAMRGVRIFYKNREVAVADALSATPSLFSFFRSRTRIHFKGQVHGGFLRGEADVGEAAPRTTLRLLLSGLRLETSPALRELAGFSVSGGLDSKCEFRLPGKPGEFPSAHVLIGVSGVELAKASLPPSIRRLTFRRLEAKLVALDGRIRVERFTASGYEADARMAGWIDVKRPFGKSILNVEGTILPHAMFLSDLEKDYPGLPALAGKSAGFSLKIDGVVDAPGYSLK